MHCITGSAGGAIGCSANERFAGSHRPILDMPPIKGTLGYLVFVSPDTPMGNDNLIPNGEHIQLSANFLREKRGEKRGS